MSLEPLLSARTVRAAFGGVTGMTVYRWVKAGLLPRPVKINGRNYWHEADVHNLYRRRGSGDEQAAK